MTLTAAQGEQIDQAVVITKEALKLVAMTNPSFSLALPFLNMFLDYEAKKLKIGIVTGQITMGPQGIISKEWAADPRHQLDSNGNFVDRRW